MLYLLVHVVGGAGVVLLLIVAMIAMIVLPVVCCKRRNRRGGHDLHHPEPESASKPTAESNTQESTFTEEEQPVPASRNVDVDGVNESPLGSVDHHTTITHEVFIL